GVRRRKQLADERHRSNLPAPRAAGAAREPRGHERRAAAGKVAGVGSVFADLPSAEQADAVGVKEAPEAFSIGAPPQVRGGVERALGRAFEARRPAARQQSAEHGLDGDVGVGKRRLAFATPYLLVRVRQERVDDVTIARAGVQAVFVGEPFRADFYVL